MVMEIMTCLFHKRMLYLSGASVLATSISLGPRRFLQPSTASSFARHSAMTGPLQNTNKGLKFKVRMTRICLLSPQKTLQNEQCCRLRLSIAGFVQVFVQFWIGAFSLENTCKHCARQVPSFDVRENESHRYEISFFFRHCIGKTKFQDIKFSSLHHVYD